MAMFMHLMSQRSKFSLTCGSMSTQMQHGIFWQYQYESNLC